MTEPRNKPTMKNISKPSLLSLLFPFPPLNVQRELVAEIEAKRAEIARLKAEAEELRNRTRREVEEMILGVCPVEGV